MKNKGVTLLELLIVMIIIGILASAAVKTWDVTLERQRIEETIKELDEIGRAIVGDERVVYMGTRVDFGFVGDCGMLPRALIDLSLKPDYVDSALWKGPYIKSIFAENPKGFLTDAWGDSYKYYPESLIIRSYAGSNEVNYQKWLTKKLANSFSDLFNNEVSGLVYDAFGNTPDSLKATNILITLFHPREGKLIIDSIHPRSGGNFIYSGISIGKRRLVCVYRDTLQYDSIEKIITVYPRIGAKNIELKFSRVNFQE
ncbi:MAG: type II secretion system GspH family protein [candidate division WOR-3 bacterium]|nr:type II secretion system GspH family protein [candidate division WOR-3 bacterium]MCX7836551.1 type II secretion system GspH family protein [candidate division WOR-3 bacterium]MDW8113896.1 prepilin-type N-terminal cleavage/methylation domain-containing protein [candidate division WOR-3 bacterium]